MIHDKSTLPLILHRPAPKNEDEMMVAIFEYIDRLFNIVRPRRVLYMAIDGVVSDWLKPEFQLSSVSLFFWLFIECLICFWIFSLFYK